MEAQRRARVAGQGDLVDRVLAVLDEPDSLVGQAVGEVFSLGTFLEVGQVVRAEIAFARHAKLATTDVDLEPVRFGAGLPVAEVPFADVPCLVAAFAERGGQRYLVHGQIVVIRHVEQLPNAVAADVLRDAHRGRIFPGQDTGPRRGADGCRGIGVVKAQAACRQLVQVRGLVKIASGADQIPPAKVVDQDEEDVRALIRHRTSEGMESHEMHVKLNP